MGASVDIGMSVDLKIFTAMVKLTEGCSDRSVGKQSRLQESLKMQSMRESVSGIVKVFYE